MHAGGSQKVIKGLLVSFLLGLLGFLAYSHRIETRNFELLQQKGRVELAIKPCTANQKASYGNYLLGEVCPDKRCNHLMLLEFANSRSSRILLQKSENGNNVVGLFDCKNDSRGEWEYSVNGLTADQPPNGFSVNKGDKVLWEFVSNK